MQHRWTVESIRPWVLSMVELFGPGNGSMFGTNWPVDAVYASYLMTVNADRQILAEGGFGRDACARMLCTNAEDFYRI